nr:MAG TPA: hypothetical protein [Caudoviricetes sp.]
MNRFEPIELRHTTEKMPRLIEYIFLPYCIFK